MELLVLDDDDLGLARFKKLRGEALAKAPEAFGASLDDFLNESDQFLRGQIKKESNRFVLAILDENGSDICAMGGFFRRKGRKLEHKGVIWGVYVTPTKRGKGLAAKLMQGLISKVKSDVDVEAIQLTVSEGNEPAIRLYERLGFKAYGREERALRISKEENFVYLDEVMMELRLK